MAKEGLHYTISAKDQSSKVLRGVLGTISGFSSQATRLLTAPFKAITSVRWAGLQANVQVLRGLTGQMDALIDRGTRLQVVNKSFESLTGRTGGAAKRLTREIQDASHGMLTLARSQEIANRALAGGLSVPQIKTAIDFISRKAVTTGKDVAQSLDTVITGLSRGSTLFLDDFGILVDGVPQVRREFDRIKGSGAFDQLGMAAQKAETVRAAIEDMNRQMVSMGVNGNEAVFQWAKIKSSITDSSDRIVAAATSSEALRNVLGDVSKVFGGIADSLGGPDQNKAVTALWSRMKEGAAAVLGDIGELLARPLMDGLSKVAAYFGDLLTHVADKFVARIIQTAKKIPLLAGQIPDDLSNWAFKTVMSKAPQMPGLGAGGAPFHRTQAWWGGTVKQFAGMGQDAIERENAAMAAKLTPLEMRRLETEKRREQRALTVLEGLTEQQRGWKYVGAGRAQVAAEIEGDPALARMTRAQQEERARQYSRERVQAEMQQHQRRLNELDARKKAADEQAAAPALTAVNDPARRAAQAALRASIAADNAAAVVAIPASQPAAAAVPDFGGFGWPAPPPPPFGVQVEPFAKPAGRWRRGGRGARVPAGGGAPWAGLKRDYGRHYKDISRQFGPGVARAWSRIMRGGITAGLAAPAMMAAPATGILGVLARFAALGQAGGVGADIAGLGVGAATGSTRGQRVLEAMDWGTIGGDAGMRLGAGIGARIGGHIGWAPMLGLGAVGAMGGLLGGMMFNGRGGGGTGAAADITEGSRELASAATNFRSTARMFSRAAREGDQAARELAAVVALV